VSDDVHVVLDETAMVAAGTGNLLASRLITLMHFQAGWHLYAPAVTLVEADRLRPGTAEHLVSMPGLIVLELDLAAALALGRETGWGKAHAGYSAAPTPELPDGAYVATADPGSWAGQPVRLFDLTP
jgi:hypothetical protein